MQVSVIGCGRWGSLIAWYLDGIGHSVALYGRAESPHFQAFLQTRKNDILELSDRVRLTSDLADACRAEILLISVPSQKLRSFFAELKPLDLHGKEIVLCMKGLEVGTGKRLSQIAEEELPPDNRVAVWLGPGHVQEFLAGVPNCMVIDSRHEDLKKKLIEAFSGKLIRFYYGEDLIGNEIGAATKNVIGIAAGMLDGLHLSTLKGALMSRGTHEIAALIGAMGGNPFSAYGLCHLGDYEATVFSPYSHNRAFGECIASGKTYSSLAEGYATAAAVMALADRYGVELPICRAVYRVLYENAVPAEELVSLFNRSLKREWNSGKDF